MYPSDHQNFKLYAQVFKVGENIPTYGAARGGTKENPYFNPSKLMP